VLADYLQGATEIAFDFETAPDLAWAADPDAALDPHKAHIVGISLAVAAETGIYVPLAHDGFANADREGVLDYLRNRVFEHPSVLKIVHNLCFETKFLLALGIVLVPPVYDTMAAAQLVLKDENHFRRLGDVGLKTLARDWFKRELPSYRDTVGTGCFGDLDPAASGTIAYACADADIALGLYALENAWFRGNIPAHEKLIRELESPVALFTALMEYRGFLVDRTKMAAADEQAQKQLGSYRRQLENSGSRPVRVGENAATNDLKHYLFNDLGIPVLKETDTGRPSVDGEALSRMIEHCREHQPACRDYISGISAYRGLSKLLKTYIRGIGEKINPVTQAIHTQFLPLGAETGRFSSQHPNCQNLPGGDSHGVRIREFFMARPGHTLVALDYSQIELRIGAWFTRDANMLAVYQNNGDIHAVTTAAVYGISLDQARDKNQPQYKARRAVAKNINFGIFYGLYPRGLQRILRLKADQDQTIAACEAMIFNIHQAYPALAPWQWGVKEAARYRETVDTANGRRRCLSGINAPDEALQAHFERAALNHPIQGTAADILKLAMVRLVDGLAMRHWIHPLITVHDEIVFEVETAHLDDAIPWLKAVMEEEPFADFDVPLVVEAATGQTYGTLTPWE